MNWAYEGPRHRCFKRSSANANARPGLQTPGLCARAVSFPLMALHSEIIHSSPHGRSAPFILAIAFSITPSECSTNPNCRTCAELISVSPQVIPVSINVVLLVFCLIMESSSSQPYTQSFQESSLLSSNHSIQLRMVPKLFFQTRPLFCTPALKYCDTILILTILTKK